MILEGHYPYFFVFFFLVSLSIVYDFFLKSSKVTTALFIISLIFLSLFAGTRVGWRDQSAYSFYYEKVTGFGPLSVEVMTFARGEHLFLVFNHVAKLLYNNPISIFVVMAFIGVSFNLLSFKKYSPYVFMSTVMYYVHNYFLREMTQIRAGVAAAIILFGIKYIADKTAWKFLILVVIAFMFHNVALVGIIGYLLWRANLSNEKLMFLIFSSLVVGSFMPIGKYLITILPNSFGVIERAERYLYTEQFNYALGVLNPTTMKQFIICLVGLKYRKLLCQRLKYFEVLLVFYCASTMWLFVFNDFAIFAGRVATFLSVGEPVIVASLLLVFRKNNRMLVAPLIYAYSFAVLWIHLVFNERIPAYVSVLF